MKINAEIFAYIDEEKLKGLIESNAELKSLIDEEMSRMADEGIVKSGGCGCKGHHSGDSGGCGSGGCGCGGCGKDASDFAYYTTALTSLFNYYIPDDVKNALHMSCDSFIE